MLDVEVPNEAVLQLIEQLRGVLVGEAGVVQDDVRGKGGQVGSDRPDVQVVDVVDVVDVAAFEEGRTDVGEVDALRCGFEQNPAGVPQQPPRGFAH